MELLGLDDYGIDSLRAFAKSQHDWVISSIDDFTPLEDPSGELLMVSLLYGCDPHEGIKRLKRQDYGMSNKVTRDVRCNLTFNKSTWYDNLRLSRSLLPNKSIFGVHRLYPYELLMYQGENHPTAQETHNSIDLISVMLILDITERDRQWLSKIDEIYRRSFLMSAYLHVLGTTCHMTPQEHRGVELYGERTRATSCQATAGQHGRRPYRKISHGRSPSGGY